MENKNWGLEKVWSGIGWGILFILVGLLIFADNKGWMPGGVGWLYFAIGLGGIFIIGFLVRCFGTPSHRWGGFGGLMVGIALVYIGMAFLNGFGDWWPLVLIPVGIGFLVKGIWHRNSQSYVH
jgi:hypothetical protein